MGNNIYGQLLPTIPLPGNKNNFLRKRITCWNEIRYMINIKQNNELLLTREGLETGMRTWEMVMEEVTSYWNQWLLVAVLSKDVGVIISRRGIPFCCKALKTYTTNSKSFIRVIVYVMTDVLWLRRIFTLCMWLRY